MKPKTIHPLLALSVFFLSITEACGPSTPSEEPLTFFEVRAEDVTDRSAIIRFETSAPATCEVRYGLAEDELGSTATDPSMRPDEPYAIEHSVPLGGLTPATTYFFRAEAVDRGGGRFSSEIGSFVTLADSASGLVNVALPSMGTRVLAVSSNYGGAENSEAWGVDGAIDGNVATEWATDGDGDGAFVELDLGQSRSVAQLRYQSREMADGSSIVLGIRFIADGALELGPFDCPDPRVMYAFDLDPPVTARRIRLEATRSTGGNTGAREVQLCSALTCIPRCTDRACGPDGCGGECGTCATGACDGAGRCVACAPRCAGRECGSDGCGGQCGTCDFGSCQPVSGLCDGM